MAKRKKRISFPMPQGLPRSFKDVDLELTNIVTRLSQWRERNPEFFQDFLDEFESLHLESLSFKGERRQIYNVTLLLIWAQMMCVLKEKKEE